MVPLQNDKWRNMKYSERELRLWQFAQLRTHKIDRGWNPCRSSEKLVTDAKQQNEDIKKFNNLKLVDIGSVSLVESPIPFIQRNTTSHTPNNIPSAVPLTELQISQ